MMRADFLSNMLGFDFHPLTAPSEVVLDNEILRLDSLIQTALDMNMGTLDEVVEWQKMRNDLMQDQRNNGWLHTVLV